MGKQGARRRAAILASAVAVVSTAYFAPTASAAPPPNDNFADATVLGPTLPDDAPGTNAEATVEPGEPNHTAFPASSPAESSVWYRWTPASDVSAVLDVCDNTSTPLFIPIRVAVYTGNSIATLGAPIALGFATTGSPGSCAVRFQASAGTTYSIAVEVNKNLAIANFTVRLRQLAPPANDNYAAATVVGPTLPVAAPATTIDANPEAGEPAVLADTPTSARSVWFKWTSGVSGQIRVDGCDWEPRSGDANTAIGVYTDTNDALPVGASVAESPQCQVDFNAVSGQQYRIAFSGARFGEGDFTLRIRSTTPPVNDNFASAIALGPALPISLQGNNSFATPQAGEPAHGGGSNARSVWYTWTPTAAEAGLVAFNVCRADGFNANLGLYTGSNLASLNPVGTVPGGVSPYCYKLYNAAAGTTYRIAVSSEDFPGSEGDFQLDIHRPQPPANDDFANAQAIGSALPIAVSGTTEDGTEQDAAGEPSHWGFNNPLHSVWYRWTAPASEAVTVDVCDADFDSALTVYTGENLGALSEIAQADQESCGPDQGGSTVFFAATAGQSYAIAVDARDPGHWGTFTLRVNGPSGTPVTPTPVTPPTSNPPATEPFDLKRAIKRCRKKFDDKGESKKRKRCIRRARRRAEQA